VECLRAIASLRRQLSILDLALDSAIRAGGLEHLWLNEICLLALTVEERAPLGSPLSIAHLTVELRSRIAIAVAAARAAESRRRPIIVMGALHLAGLALAGRRAGAEIEAWVHPSLPSWVRL
jgi:hypothetical protein